MSSILKSAIYKADSAFLWENKQWSQIIMEILISLDD